MAVHACAVASDWSRFIKNVKSVLEIFKMEEKIRFQLANQILFFLPAEEVVGNQDLFFIRLN